jgi:hypothetical protein
MKEPASSQPHIIEMKNIYDTTTLLDLADSVFQHINKDIVDRYVIRFERETYTERRSMFKKIYYDLFIKDGYSPLEAFIFSEIPSVESAYRSNVKSSAGAVGQWQLMPATARGYGLTVSGNIDERKNPLLAYQASEKYIRNLKKSARGNIVRILYGYNGGPGKALFDAQPPLETRHFVAKIYASLIRFESK